MAIRVSLDHIRHPLLLHLLVDSMVHRERKIVEVSSSSFGRLARLLAVACCFNENSTTDERSLGLLNTTIDRLMKLRTLCDSIINSAYGSLSFDQPKLILTFVNTPLLARCVLQWVDSYINDDVFMTKTPNLALLPVFLQFVAAVSTTHPLQRDDCFEIIKVRSECLIIIVITFIVVVTVIIIVIQSLLKRSPSIASDGPSYSAHHSQAQLASAHSQAYLACQKDALETLVHLMCTGYVSKPLFYERPYGEL